MPAEPDTAASPRALRDVYTVSRLNLEARALLEEGFATIWIEGEISNLARPRSGHLYFSLKDDQCQVRCAMFRMHNRQLDFEPADGMQVLANARVSLYPERGEFQLVVRVLEEAGAGALRRAFEALKHRLAAEGLFDAARKRPLPRLPACVGVVTSPTGAALRDVLNVLGRRFPAVPVVVYPVPVQGAGAGAEIARMLGVAGHDGRCDVLLLVRGGGSIEDLWSFNEEIVARAIRASAIPVVSGVGHEIDFTIADLAADQRAPTPSAAAELVVPDAAEWRERLRRVRARLDTEMRERVAGDRQALGWLVRRLRHPRRRLQEIAQRIEGLRGRLARAVRAVPASRRARVHTLVARLERHSPGILLGAYRLRADGLARRLREAGRRSVPERRIRLDAVHRALETVSPVRTLERGYAIVTRRADGAVVRAAAEVRPGERVEARLASGRLVLGVDEVIEDGKAPGS